MALHLGYMFARVLPLCFCFAGLAAGQKVCAPTPAYTPCEIAFDLSPDERDSHANPYLTVQIRAELRSPRHRTISLPAFWDGEKMLLRFAPTEPGPWDYRVTSNIARYNNAQGQVTAVESQRPGYIAPANGHHWRWTESKKAHLWMGLTMTDWLSLSDEDFRKQVDERVSQKLTHLRGYAVGLASFPNPDEPDPAFYRKLDDRIAYISDKGLVADLILGLKSNYLIQKFPGWQQRDRYIRYMTARYSAFNVTWEAVEEFESYTAGRDIAKEIGLLLKKHDPYGHPRTAGAAVTSSPLLNDGWMDFVHYGSGDDQLGSIEHQLYAVPFVGANVSGTGAAFRQRLWNTTMNGQYPVALAAGPAEAKALTTWLDFTSDNRYWEFEPYFDLDGGRAIAVPGVEYIVYVEKPAGPIEIRMEKHGYDARWIDPATGEVTLLKNFKGEKFVAEPPDNAHDWVLHLSREGRKESMLNSYKFESRAFLAQDVETGAAKFPYSIAEPAAEEIASSKPVPYAAKLKRDTRGTRSMMYLWTGEVGTEGQGFRVLGTGATGSFQLPTTFLKDLPAIMNVRLHGMNANGKLYSADRIYRIVP